MLISAERVGISMDDFYISCLDKLSYDAFRPYPNIFMWIDVGYINEKLSEYQNWTFDANSGFRNIVKYKWKIIENVYRQHKELCWVDTDIVFKKNPIKIIENKEKILFQSDRPGSTLCSGFMVFNSSSYSGNLIKECSSKFEEDDQLLVNYIALSKYYEQIEILDEALFPNGNVYYIQNKKENAFIVHNNWMVGVTNKIEKFKEEGLWFL